MTSIRTARAGDAAGILEIYAPVVRDTAISFELEIPDVAEIAARIARVQERFPWLVAVEGDVVEGYAYATSFRARAAYDWAVETAVYVREGGRRRGVARALYETLCGAAEAMQHRSQG